MAETCSHCGTFDGHASDCPMQDPGRWGVTDDLTPEINEAVDYDDRKTLAEIWQLYAPLPEIGLREGTYDALLHVAKWGARQALERRDERA